MKGALMTNGDYRSDHVHKEDEMPTPASRRDGKDVSKWVVAALVVLGATVLGATALSEPIAYAAQSIEATVVGPVDEQGHVKVHEQGIAKVEVTNSRREPVLVNITDTKVPVEQVGDPVTIDCTPAGYTVPENKRLVIEYVNAFSNDPQELFGLTIEKEDGTPERILYFGGTPFEHLGDVWKAVSEPVTILVGPKGGASSPNECTLYGYLLDA